jgi:hypothetical protein
MSRAQFHDGFGERIGQVAVFALAEAVAAHGYGGTKRLVLVVEPDQPGGVGASEQALREGAAEVVEPGCDRCPV